LAILCSCRKAVEKETRQIARTESAVQPIMIEIETSWGIWYEPGKWHMDS